MNKYFDLVIEAQKRLEGHAHVTPVMTSQTLNDITGAQIFLKCENFQRMGAFKFRGAFNAMSQLTEEQKKRGVLTYSSGNHAQAVALVGRLLAIRTVVIMPNNAPVIKREATEAYGATVVEYNPEETTREEICRDLESRHGHTIVPPFDHINIVAGQGTAAKELIDEVKTLDMLLTPCGGGGLLSGCAVAAKGMDPNCQVIGIESEVADDATKSFHTGQLHTIKDPPTIADGTRTPSLGEVTFPLVLEYVDDMQTVPEAAIMDAVKFLFYRMKLVVEPSGALPLAALLVGSVRPQGRVGIILSGGNIDGVMMKQILDS
jgi:threonine dehydratase